jgi:asparagine synthase (glutamine-hydrolysing)
MCGIAGIITKNSSLITNEKIKAMTDAIAHRGPDGEGIWINDSNHIGMGHRRLSIIDLSHEADQPMHFLGRYTIVFNGEIYNYIELKEILVKQGYTFKTHSDTEVLMALYDRDKENCLQLLDGMFSFVIFDKKENEIFCARDRFGEKPFFYSYVEGEHFYFGSEMKSLWAGGVKKIINNKMLFNYISYGNIENHNNLSETFYENCARLEHSHFLKVNVKSIKIKKEKYYKLNWEIPTSNISISKACEKFEELFYTSIKRRLRSDVSIGSSLSGGLDSSLVVCVIDAINKGKDLKQNTFSAIFPGFERDEKKYMDFVIAKTNVNSYFVCPNDQGLVADIEKLTWHQEEPYGSASIYAQYCVMKLAKQKNTTVLLDGQGADEILAGYHSYYIPFFNEIRKNKDFKSQLLAYKRLHASNSINGIAKRSVGDIVRSISPSLVQPIKKIKNSYTQTITPIFNKDFFREYNGKLFDSPGNSFDSLNETLHNTTLNFGMQQLLRYADRNSMANSIEVRLPFLSHELVEFLFTLPPTFKINEGWTKWIMRETFEDLIPKEIAWRKDKIGYEPPQKSWMEKKEMQEMIRNSREKLFNNNFLNKKYLESNVGAVDVLKGNQLNWYILQAGLII